MASLEGIGELSLRLASDFRGSNMVESKLVDLGSEAEGTTEAEGEDSTVKE